MLTDLQIREARTLLGLQRNELAARVTTITTATIMRTESVDDEPPITLAQAAAIEQAFDRAGIKFTADGPQLRQKNSDA